ncbi:hypothetical protein HPP92_024847 [Vanilla planifolia]|uniref:Uncharacterized protein n=1 Tax=Vanilla planifolia TaxID=51239 RepID=A0A835PLJ0_VANPL|nr:hypothetical protein HPP92_024847 [Vanilla planifolia]
MEQRSLDDGELEEKNREGIVEGVFAEPDSGGGGNGGVEAEERVHQLVALVITEETLVFRHGDGKHNELADALGPCETRL